MKLALAVIAFALTVSVTISFSEPEEDELVTQWLAEQDLKCQSLEHREECLP